MLMNAKLESAEGERQLTVAAACTELIKDFEQVTYKENSQVIDKERDPQADAFVGRAGVSGVAGVSGRRRERWWRESAADLTRNGLRRDEASV